MKSQLKIPQIAFPAYLASPGKLFWILCHSLSLFACHPLFKTVSLVSPKIQRSNNCGSINLSVLIIPPQLLCIIKSSTPLTCRLTVTELLYHQSYASEMKALQQLFPLSFFFSNVKPKILEENRIFTSILSDSQNSIIVF